MASAEPARVPAPAAEPAGVADPSCIFCRIVAGAIPATVVAQSELALAFRDLNPVAPTHVLVVPRAHIANAAAVGADDGPALAAMLALASEVAAADDLTERGYRLVFNVGDDAGMTVHHLHLHVIGGRAMGWPPFPR